MGELIVVEFVNAPVFQDIVVAFGGNSWLPVSRNAEYCSAIYSIVSFRVARVRSQVYGEVGIMPRPIVTIRG